MRQVRCLLVELAIRQGSLTIHDGQRVWRAAGYRTDAFNDIRGNASGSFKALPAPLNLNPFLRGQKFQCADRMRGRFGDAGEQRLKVFGHTLYGRALEEILAKFEVSMQGIVSFSYGKA
jgi:hypothetical protein